MGINEINGVTSQAQTQSSNAKLYDTKEKRKAAVNQAIQDYMTFNKMNEKEAKKASFFQKEQTGEHNNFFRL